MRRQIGIAERHAELICDRRIHGDQATVHRRRALDRPGRPARSPSHRAQAREEGRAHNDHLHPERHRRQAAHERLAQAWRDEQRLTCVQRQSLLPRDREASRPPADRHGVQDAEPYFQGLLRATARPRAVKAPGLAERALALEEPASAGRLLREPDAVVVGRVSDVGGDNSAVARDVPDVGVGAWSQPADVADAGPP